MTTLPAGTITVGGSGVVLSTGSGAIDLLTVLCVGTGSYLASIQKAYS